MPDTPDTSREAVERLRQLVAMHGDYADFDTLRALLAERDRLRDALRNLLQDTQHDHHNCGDADCPVLLARAALKGGGDE